MIDRGSLDTMVQSDSQGKISVAEIVRKGIQYFYGRNTIKWMSDSALTDVYGEPCNFDAVLFRGYYDEEDSLLELPAKYSYEKLHNGIGSLNKNGNATEGGIRDLIKNIGGLNATEKGDSKNIK